MPPKKTEARAVALEKEMDTIRLTLTAIQLKMERTDSSIELKERTDSVFDRHELSSQYI